MELGNLLSNLITAVISSVTGAWVTYRLNKGKTISENNPKDNTSDTFRPTPRNLNAQDIKGSNNCLQGKEKAGKYYAYIGQLRAKERGIFNHFIISGFSKEFDRFGWHRFRYKKIGSLFKKKNELYILGATFDKEISTEQMRDILKRNNLELIYFSSIHYGDVDNIIK